MAEEVLARERILQAFFDGAETRTTSSPGPALTTVIYLPTKTVLPLSGQPCHFARCPMQVDEYVDAVYQIIKTHERADGIKASALGQLIRRALPSEPWSAYGFHSLKDVLAPLEQRGLIRMDGRGGTLAIWLTAKESEQIPLASATKKYSPLKKDAWLAFAVPRPPGKRYMHRTSGVIRMGLSEIPHPADRWVEIEQISDDKQKIWAKAFATGLGGKFQNAVGALDDPSWFTQFGRALREIDGDKGHQWNVTRTEKVSACVADWCEKHKIETSLVFEQRTHRVTLVAAPTEANTKPIHQGTAREALLAALSRMTTHELSQLAIPAHYLLQELGMK
jgi:hypothetical protein